MDRNEKAFMDNMSKLSLSEIRDLFKNLKEIGLEQDVIDKYAEEYHKFFIQRSNIEKEVNADDLKVQVQTD